MDNYSVMMSAAAAEDIGGIADYIANTLLEPETAAKLIGRLRTAVKSLETMPERHPLVGVPRNPKKALRAVSASNGAWIAVSDEDILATMAPALKMPRKKGLLLPNIIRSFDA